MARQSKYDESQLILVEGWARDGLTEAQVAHNLGVTYETLRQWKMRHPAFLAAIKRGKEVVDREVENALYKSALGFDYAEEAVTNKGDVVTVTRHATPNVTAQIFWLKNRKPGVWRDRKELAGDADAPLAVGVTHDVAERLTPYVRTIDALFADLVSADAGRDGDPEPLDPSDPDPEAG